MNASKLLTIDHAAAMFGYRPEAFRTVIARRHYRPHRTINGTPMYTQRDIARIARTLSMRERTTPVEMS